MGKLLDMLERASSGVGHSMGFSAINRGEKVPPMLLLGCAGGDADAAAKHIVEAGLDGALLAVDSAGKRAQAAATRKTLEGMAWGVWQSEAGPQPEEGADFEVFSSDETPLSVLNSEEHTAIMQVSPELDDALLRCIEDVPVDAFLVSVADAPSLTVRQLMRIARVRSVVSKYLLVHLAALPSKEDMARLRDVGVDAMVVDVASHSVDALKACHVELQELSHSAPQRRRDRPSPLLPPVNLAAGPERQEDEDDDEYE